MKILGISCSARKLGNSEIMVKHSLMHLKKNGHEVALIRIPNLRINSCIESYACNYVKGFCSVEKNDDFVKLVDEIKKYDRLVLGVPTLTWMPPGVLKLIADRAMYSGNNLQGQSIPSIVFVASGVKELSNLVQHLVEPLLVGLNLDVVSYVQDIGNFTGPGEVSLRQAILHEIERECENLVKEIPLKNEYLRCPACAYRLLITPNKNGLSCSFCSSDLKVIYDSDGNISYSFEDGLKVFRAEEHLRRMVDLGKENIKKNYTNVIKAKSSYRDDVCEIPLIAFSLEEFQKRIK
jgi:NAD(P)H-dependent FMN reductase